MKIIIKHTPALVFSMVLSTNIFLIANTHALEPLAENELQQVLGQGGVYLSGDITINESGGPLNNTADASNPGIWQKNCTASSTDKRLVQE